MDILKKIGQAIPSKAGKKMYMSCGKPHVESTSAISGADGGITKSQQKTF